MATIQPTHARGNQPHRNPAIILGFVTAALCAAATISATGSHPTGDGPSVVGPIAVEDSPPDDSPLPAPSARDSTSSTASRDVHRPAARATRVPAVLGTATVVYVVGLGNGDGANIEIPLRRLDGFVIAPGATFDFWKAVGEVSRRTGYRLGAIIIGGRIDTQGALAGGICTVSTVLFDAAARAGLEIRARTSHHGYLAKYPLGLDAAVAKGDGVRQTLSFRNDTAEPITIRTVSTPGIARVDLIGSVALDRTVAFSTPSISGRVRAHDRHRDSRSVPRGEHRRLEDRSDGMTVVVRRTVRDAAGSVLHRDRWVSVYRPLSGLVLDGTG